MSIAKLHPISLSAMFINPTINDGLVYSNISPHHKQEGFIQFYQEAQERIANDIKLIAPSCPRITELVNLPAHQFPPQGIGVLDKLFTTIDSQYLAFGEHLPRYTLRVYSGIVFSHLTTAEWKDILEVLLAKFPDIERFFDKEIPCVSQKVLDIINHADVYYRRACFLSRQAKIAEESLTGGLIGLSAVRAKEASLKLKHSSHLVETAPFLDEIDGSINLTANPADKTSIFDNLRPTE